MPKITATEEEIALLKRIRAKNAETLGRNEALEQAILLAKTTPLVHDTDPPEDYAKAHYDWLAKFTEQLAGMKRELVG